MIDCGIPFGAMTEDLYKTDYILITHTHSDHLKLPTLNTIRKKFPHIKVYGNYEVAYMTKLDRIVANYQEIMLPDWIITPFPCVHDVVTHGYVLDKPDLSIIYATDTATLDNAPKKPYDMLFLESNHDETKIKQVQGRRTEYGYDVYQSALRHLSTQSSKAFYYMHRRNKQSPYIELHQSKRFY